MTRILGTVAETGSAVRYEDKTMCADEIWDQCVPADRVLFENREALKIFLDASARYVDPAYGASSVLLLSLLVVQMMSRLRPVRDDVCV